jgi:hypothetical protein
MTEGVAFIDRRRKSARENIAAAIVALDAARYQIALWKQVSEDPQALDEPHTMVRDALALARRALDMVTEIRL